MTDLHESNSMGMKEGGLYRGLIQSHMTVAGVVFGMLVLILLHMVSFRSVALRATQQASPSVYNSMRVLQGTQRTLAATRGWVALGDPEFNRERANAWANDIEHSLAQLERLSADWRDEEDRVRLRKAKVSLQELKKTQWWIEEMAQAPGNEPARVLNDVQLHPIAEQIGTSIEALVAEETVNAGNAGNSILYRRIALLQLSFLETQQLIQNIVDTGQPTDIAAFRDAVKRLGQNVHAIGADTHLLSNPQRERLAHIVDLLSAYGEISADVIDARESPQSNMAMFLLRNEGVPAAREAIRLLTDLSENQADLMRQDALSMATQDNVLLFLSPLAIGGLIWVILYLSRRNAELFTRPIALLAQGAERMATGELQSDLPVTSNHELGLLTQSFNRMRTQLNDREEQIFEFADSVSKLEARFRATVESAPTAMVMVDESGMIVLVNAETERLFHYERDELIGEQLEVLLPARYREKHVDQRHGFFANPSSRRMGEARELYGRRRNGSEFPVEIGLNPLRTDEGAFVLSTIIDVTDRRDAERQIEEANTALARSNAELEQFAYIASHDLQEPLRKISSYCELLKEEQGNRLDEDGISYLNVAINGAARLRVLIRDLLTFSRINTKGKSLAATDAGESLRAAIEQLELAIEDNGAQVTFDPLPQVMADESQLLQLFQNLIGNAIKYRGEAAPRIHIGGREVDRDFEFFVKDNGIGIDPQFSERIFQIFQRLHNRREYSGTGIGLALCKRIVERSGGKIWVESESNVGSTFYFTLRTVTVEEEAVRNDASLERIAVGNPD